MTYVDRTLSCVDCGVEFIHSAADQEFYAQKGFVSDPKRCTGCRASRRSMRETSGYDVRDIGHLFIRRHRHSPDVAREVGHMWAERPEPEVIGVPADPAEDAVAAELSRTWLHPADGAAPVSGAGRQLFPWVLAKAFLFQDHLVR